MEKVHLEIPRYYLCPSSSNPAFTPISGQVQVNFVKVNVSKCLNTHDYVILQGKSMEAGVKAGQKLPYNSDN